MKLKLKRTFPAFQETDGAFAGRKYTHEETYASADIPADKQDWFEQAAAPAPAMKEEDDGSR